MIIGDYRHLPLQDKLSFVKLLLFIEGLESKARFNKIVNGILDGCCG
jgi:hypothetical protein